MEFYLKKWKKEYIADVAFYANNDNIAANLRDVFPFPYTVEDAGKYVMACAENDEKRQMCRAIEIEGRAVGSIGVFLGDDVYSKSAELGYWLAQPYWGEGIMTRAVRRICAEAFEKYDIFRIFAEPYAYNTGSRRVLEKAGFELEGIMRKGVCKRGKMFDYCMYSLIK